MSLTAAPPRARSRQGVIAAIAYVGGVALTAMDLQIVNVALPSIARGFGSSLADVQWVVVGYALSVAVVIPASGWIGDRFGTKRTFLLAVVGFTVASALCGIAPSLPALVAARVVQGVCGGLLTTSGTALLYRAFPADRRAVMARVVIAPVLLAPTIAPLLGGVLTDALSWRWVFYVNLPVGIVLAVVISRYLNEYRQDAKGSLDFPALIASALGLSAVIYAISEGAIRGWSSLPIVLSGVLGIALLGWFVRRSLRSDHPVLDLRLLEDRLFRADLIALGLSTAAFFGMLYLVPLFLQEADHQTPLGSGATTFVEALGVFCASQTLGRLYPRLGPRVMATFGGFGIALVMVWMAQDAVGTNLWIIRGQMFLVGAMNSAVFLPVQSSVFTNISHRSTAHASAIFVTQRQTAVAVGIAILTSILTGASGPLVHRFHLAFLAGAVLAVLAGVAAFTLIHTDDALESMRGRHSEAEAMPLVRE
jgi:EmrB/QacA subfamily drug resistance transporter